MENLMCKKCNCLVSEDNLIIEIVNSVDLLSPPDYNEICPECNECSEFDNYYSCY